MKKTNKTHLFILHEAEKINYSTIRGLKTDSNTLAKIIIFNDNNEFINSFISHIKKTYKKVEIINAAGKLEKIAFKIRNGYAQLVSNAKNIQIDKKSLNEYLVYDSKLSTWWLNEIFHKRSYKFKTFTYLCQLMFLKDILKRSGRIHNAIVLSKSPLFLETIEKYLDIKKINHVKSINYFLVKKLKELLQLSKYIVVFNKWFIEFLIITILAKIYNRKEVFKNKITFIQFYTAFWPKEDYFKDDKFGKKNEILKSFKKNEIISLVTLFPDGIHTSIKFYNFFEILRKKSKKNYDKEQTFFLERFINFRKIFKLFFYCNFIIFKLFKLSKKENFKNHWIFDDFDIYPLIREEFYQSMRRIPRFFFYIERLKTFTTVANPKCIIYNMFETPIGKSTTFAIKTISPKTPVVSTQDGPINRLKLETTNIVGEFPKAANMNFINFPPLPDMILVEGKYGKELLVESGYPEKIISVGGSSRMIGLNSLPFKSKNKKKISQNRILVAFGINDHEPILNLCITYLKQQTLTGKDPNTVFVFKTHPRGVLEKNKLSNLLLKNNITQNVILSNEPVWKEINNCNYIIGTFTSVLNEAAVKGYNVISLLFGSRINNSVLLELNLKNINYVSKYSEFEKIIREKLENTVSLKNAQKVEKYLYYDVTNYVAKIWNKLINERIVNFKKTPSQSTNNSLTEEEIRPQKIFSEYLKLCKEDIELIFKGKKFDSFLCPSCERDGDVAFMKNNFTYKECSYCKTLYVSPRPSEKLFTRFYSKSKSSDYWATDFYPLTSENRREKLWRPKVKKIINVLKDKKIDKPSIVEIGGGYGVFAEELISQGLNEVLIVEPSRLLANSLRKKNINVVEKFLEDLRRADIPNKQTFFVCFELFEHLHSPKKFLKKLYRLMKSNDFFYFTTLSSTGIDIRTLWSKSDSVSPPHHLNFFNPYSVKILLEKIGFTQVETHTPGQLDVDIMYKNRRKIKDRFWRNYLENSDTEERSVMQNIISESGMSSHMHIICKKN